MLFKELRRVNTIGHFELIIPQNIVIYDNDEITITKMVNRGISVDIYIHLDNPYRNYECESDNPISDDSGEDTTDDSDDELTLRTWAGVRDPTRRDE
jgi:hypothetical protein